PFDGPTATDILVAVLEREPDWAALPAGVPPRVRDLLERCLRKDPTRRLRDIGDARIELKEAGGGDLAARTIDVAAAVPVSAAPASLSGAATLPPSAGATISAPVLSPARSGKGWKVALAVGLPAFLLIAGALALWLSGVFSSNDDRPGRTPTGGD